MIYWVLYIPGGAGFLLIHSMTGGFWKTRVRKGLVTGATGFEILLDIACGVEGENR